MQGLKGKNVLVTGGSSGIGQAIAVRFAEYGANVAINYLGRPEEAKGTEDQVHACVKKVQQEGVRDALVQGDVSREDDVVKMVEQTVSDLGGIDVLINNAGIQISRPSHELSSDDFEKVLAVNLRGSFLCAREALPMMASENWGRIINVSSAAARHPLAGMAAYSASKAALDQLTRILALEGEPYNIAAIGVYPGVVDTRMQEESRSFGAKLIGDQLHRMFSNYRDFGMLRQPEEPAELISYLCTPAAERLSGHIIRLEQLEALKGET